MQAITKSRTWFGHTKLRQVLPSVEELDAKVKLWCGDGSGNEYLGVWEIKYRVWNTYTSHRIKLDKCIYRVDIFKNIFKNIFNRIQRKLLLLATNHMNWTETISKSNIYFIVVWKQKSQVLCQVRATSIENSWK